MIVSTARIRATKGSRYRIQPLRLPATILLENQYEALISLIELDQLYLHPILNPLRRLRSREKGRRRGHFLIAAIS
jgi:hypothetical protein